MWNKTTTWALVIAVISLILSGIAIYNNILTSSKDNNGSQGVQGVQGIPGSAGISGYERTEESFNIPYSEKTTIHFLACSAGKKPIFVDCRLNGLNSADSPEIQNRYYEKIYITSSMMSKEAIVDETKVPKFGAYCDVRNYNNKSVTNSATMNLICANVS
ncbi:MAG TPA: hypothetical protein VJH37_00370 [Candidatus Nanoarchaeia archaeon]|nr:hypothetical protein [Candidatus Nanoarchaeia archaeon]